MMDVNSATYLDRGSDSEVFLLEDKILKKYPGRDSYLENFDSHPFEKIQKMLKMYAQDTLAARDLVKDYEFELNTNLGLYKVKVDIIPQGDQMWVDDAVYVYGQEYIPGWDLGKVFSGIVESAHPLIIDMGVNDLDYFTDIRQILAHCSLDYGYHIRRTQQLENLNVKPVVEDETLILKITDISGMLQEMYEEVLRV